MRISDATTAFLSDRARRGCNALSVNYYMRQMAWFDGWLADHGVREELDAVDARCVSLYVSDLQARAGPGSGRRLSGVTVRKRVMALKTFFRWAHESGALGTDPSKDVLVPRSPQRLPKALSPAQARRLLDAEMHARERAAIALMLDTGVRIAESCALDVDDVDLEERTVRVRMAKGAKQRVVVFESVTCDALRAWLAARAELELTDRRALFVSANGGRIAQQTLYKAIKKVAKSVGLAEVVSPHKLRHTFATMYLDNGGAIQDASELLGHNHIATTMIYTHISRAGLKRKHAVCSPLNALQGGRKG